LCDLRDSYKKERVKDFSLFSKYFRAGTEGLLDVSEMLKSY